MNFSTVCSLIYFHQLVQIVAARATNNNSNLKLQPSTLSGGSGACKQMDKLLTHLARRLPHVRLTYGALGAFK